MVSSGSRDDPQTPHSQVTGVQRQQLRLTVWFVSSGIRSTIDIHCHQVQASSHCNKQLDQTSSLPIDMSADTANLQKVDSAISGLSSSPPEKEAPKGHRRASSSAAGVYNIADLGMLNAGDMYETMTS